MRLRGQTTRSLGSAVGVSSAAVTGWSKPAGARPRPEVAKRLADYFDVTVDVLLDDSKDLPIAAVPQVVELPKPLSGSYTRAVLGEIRQKGGDKKFTEFTPEENQKLTMATLLDAIPPDVLRAACQSILKTVSETLASLGPILPADSNQLSPDHVEILAEEKRQERAEARRVKRSQSSPAKAHGAAGR